MKEIEIRGNTYPVKEQLRKLGGQWDAAKKCWLVPETKAEEARKLVATVPPKSSAGYRKQRRGTPTGCSCGSVEEFPKASDCWTCKHDF